jgi:hypothetical protein
MNFNLKNLEFTFKFTNYQNLCNRNSMVAPEAEIYIPNYHYKKLLLDIRVSDGDWRYVRSRQTLYWRVKDWTTEGIAHTLRIRVSKNSDGEEEISKHRELSSNDSIYKKLEDDTLYKIEDYIKWIMSAVGVIMVAYWWQFHLSNIIEYV